MSDKKKIKIDLDLSSITILVCWVFICLWYWDHEADNRLAQEWCLKTKACVVVPVYDSDGDFAELEIRPTTEEGRRHESPAEPNPEQGTLETP